MKKSLFLLCAALFSVTCLQRIAGTIDETETGIGLVGSLYYNGHPAQYFKARLKYTGFYAVTDKNGVYSLTVSKDSLRKKGIDLSKITDTLQYFNDTALVGDIGITSWIDSLPTLYIVQRDFFGKFTSGTGDIGKVEAVIIQMRGSDTLRIKTQSLHFFPESMGFSGFVYFTNSDSQFSYGAYINVYSKRSVFIGRSIYMGFTDDAGNIQFPDFNPCNAFPVVLAGRDTTVSAGTIVQLHARASDSFGGTIEKREWDIIGQGFREITGPDTLITAPLSPCPDVDSCCCSYLCIVRVTDNDGNQSLDTTRVTVRYDIPPAVRAGKDTTVSIGDTVNLMASASSLCGNSNYIQKIEWNINNQGFFEISHSDTAIIAPLSPDSMLLYPCIVRATDNAGEQAMDTTLVMVLKDPPRVFAGNDTMVGINAVVRLNGVATQEFGTIIKWEWNINNSGFIEASTRYTTLVMPNEPVTFTCILRVTDDDGNSGLDTIVVTAGE